MGRQIIKQPNGLYAIWSTVVDDFVAYDFSREDIIEYRLREALADIERDINKICDRLDSGKEAYQLTMSLEEAVNDYKNIHKDEEGYQKRAEVLLNGNREIALFD